MRYFLHPLIDTEDSGFKLVLINEMDESIIIKNEDVPQIAEILKGYLKNGKHDKALSWSEYKTITGTKLTTISKVLNKARIQGVKPPTARAIRKWIKGGRLTAHKVGRAWQFKEDDFFALLQARSAQRD